ncbi:hypothetical protein B0O80DRAFT_451386 [Mortierella sp. GBAus27b]|nr:hypothetical protein BGX31_001451 [Mortierella sp. GBA43]KAI8353720.1 hypothetical protein B0O80DRAFT_451386 [Mortierella sp. GBAus27b]
MLGIPELNEVICLQLDPGDLAQCSRVNKTWHSAVTPYLWRDIAWLDWHASDTQRRAFRQLVVDDFRYEQRHGIQDQDLGLEPSSTHPQSILAKYRPWVQSLPNPIIVLQLPGDTQQSTEPTVDELVLYLFKHFGTANIPHFSLEYAKFGTDDLKQSMEVILPRVLHLSVQASYRGKRGELSKLKYLLDQCSTTLEKLTLDVYFSYDDGLDVYIGYDKDFNQDEELETAEPTEWTSLKELHLRPRDCVGSPQPSTFWNWVYRRCGQVERIEVSGFRRGATISIAENMLAHMPKLNEITIGSIHGRDSSTIKEDRVASLLSGSRNGWKSVRLAGASRLGKYALEALAKHFSTLEVVHIDHVCIDSSNELAYIPSSCPNLHTFYYYREYGGFPVEVFLDKDPNTGTLKSWACEKTLKTFGATIDGIPRPGEERAYRAEEAYPGQGREKQGQVYDRIARFTNLEVLSLGNLPRPPGVKSWGQANRETYCMEMSLESGLDKLSELNSMQELNVEGLKTRIGLQEVQWMTTHWPRLRALYGLDKEGDSKEAVEWLETHHPEIQLLRQ